MKTCSRFPLLLLIFFSWILFSSNNGSGDSIPDRQLNELALKAVKLAPDQPDSARYLAYYVLGAGKAGNKPLMANGHFALGEAYYYLQEYDSALTAYETSRDLYLVVKDTSRLAAAYNNIGLLCFFKARYDRALDAYKASLELEEKRNNRLGIAQSHHNIGMIFGRWEHYDQLSEHYGIAIEIYKELGEEESVANLNNNLGVIRARQNEYTLAFDYYKKAYKAFKQLKNASGQASVLSNLGNLFENQEHFERARDYYGKAQVLFEQLNDRRGLVYTYSSIGKMYVKLKDTENALKYLLLCEEENADLGIRHLQKDNLYDIYQSYTSLGEYKDANRVLENYHAIKDSIYNEEKYARMVELEKKYQLQKNQKELIALKARTEKRMLVFKGTIVFFVLLIAFIVTLVVHTRLKEKQRRLTLEHKILRNQMNPHFIFNALSGIQCFILDNQTEVACDFLADFSGLMRMILQYSHEEQIPVSKEKQILNYYLSLQNRRFGDKIKFRIDADDDIAEDHVMIPPMLAQPFIENAIEHGELARRDNAKINLRFSKEEDRLVLTIEDNGIGIDQAKKKKRKNGHKSMAMEITRERLKLINSNSKGSRIDLQIEDLSNRGKTGTRVEFFIPYIVLN
ncbi:hypothetical protein DMA11_03905 [Marinilabiliaceae bacterium JC017]|nr:hypothetical protein DMA11_03905 [Marinilabiliaceae bacterium JC017]